MGIAVNPVDDDTMTQGEGGHSAVPLPQDFSFLASHSGEESQDLRFVSQKARLPMSPI